jgi:hypothetical protein
MIDPIVSLAFSLHSNKGVYALLVGSGVSRPAGIPTGWEVVLDLVRKLARLKAEDCEPDPAAWYKDTFGENPDYAELLSEITKSPAERNLLLRSYFEPTEEERQQGLKVPTDAHKALAELVTTESIVEDAALAWLESFGYAVKHGLYISESELATEQFLLRGTHE